MINMFLSNNPSSGDINSSNLPCFNCNCGHLGDLNLYDIENTSIIFVIRYVLTGVVITFINKCSYFCIATSCSRCLSRGMCLYQVIMTMHFLNDVVIDIEFT